MNGLLIVELKLNKEIFCGKVIINSFKSRIFSFIFALILGNIRLIGSKVSSIRGREEG